MEWYDAIKHPETSLSFSPYNTFIEDGTLVTLNIQNKKGLSFCKISSKILGYWNVTFLYTFKNTLCVTVRFLY